MQLAGQIAIVTGAGRGLGRAIAQGLAAEGAAVVLAARSSDELEETAWLIGEAGGRALPIPTDVRRAVDVDHLVAQTLTSFGAIDIVVNNAGIGLRRPIHEIDPATWTAVLDTFVLGAYHVIHAAVPGMMARKRGNIINVTAPLDRIALPGFSAYCAAKYAVEGLTQALAKELRRYAINVNAVHPGGFVATRLLHESVPELSAGLLDPQVIVPAVLSLASQPPRGLTGQSLDARNLPPST